MNKKILIPIFMMLLIVSSAMAFQLKSGDSLQFTNNADVFSGEVFVMTVIENGQQEYISWDRFSNALENQDYELEDNAFGGVYGVIYDYKLFYKGEILQQGNGEITKWVHKGSKMLDANDWCKSQTESGEVYYLRWTGTTNHCFTTETLGRYAELSSAEERYTTKFVVNNKGSESEIILNEDTTENTKVFDNRRLFSVELTDVSGTGRQIPNVDNSRALYFDSVTNSPYIIEKINYNDFDRAEILKDLRLCAEQFERNVFDCHNDINQDVYRAIEYDEGNLANQIWTAESGVMYQDGQLYGYPQYRILVNAQSIGIFRPSGEPRIDEFTIGKVKEGEGDQATIKVSNVGSGTGNFEFQFVCNGINIDPISSMQVEEGNSVNLLRDITGEAVGGCDDVSCQLIVIDKTSQNRDSEIANGEICKANDCQTSGKQRCASGNSVQTCQEVDGVLIWETTFQCPLTCGIENGNPVCIQDDNDNCNNNDVCDAGEIRSTCLNDCSVAGDNYCSPIERQTGTDPESCSTSGGDFLTTLIIILAILVIAGAIFFRLKQEGKI